MKTLLSSVAIAAVVATGAAQAADTFTVTVPAPAVPSDQNFVSPMTTPAQLSAGFRVDTVSATHARFQINGVSCFGIAGDEVRCDRGQQRVTVQVSTNGTTWVPLGGTGVWKVLPVTPQLSQPLTATAQLALPASQRVPGLRLRVACDATKLGVEEFCPIVGDAIVQFYGE